ncbi:hypothetical protein SUGI_0321070 [Cryptomeria japonica]|nr:hypothetical protein SUGI_0321070 [Cryptomeria japonica]
MSSIVYPCAACKIQRRKCGDKCVLAPYFPPNDPHKFLVVHKLFGTSNIIRTLKDIPEEKRADAVTSLVYEASARANDPIYGCTGAICRLQQRVSELVSQQENIQAELVNTQANLSSLVTGFCNYGETATGMNLVDQNDPYNKDEVRVLEDDDDPFGLWAPL